MIEKRTTVDRIEVGAQGAHVRLRKELVEDGVVVSFEYHRTGAIGSAADFLGVKESVNAHLSESGWPEPSTDDWAFANRVASASFA